MDHFPKILQSLLPLVLLGLWAFFTMGRKRSRGQTVERPQSPEYRDNAESEHEEADQQTIDKEEQTSSMDPELEEMLEKLGLPRPGHARPEDEDKPVEMTKPEPEPVRPAPVRRVEPEKPVERGPVLSQPAAKDLGIGAPVLSVPTFVHENAYAQISVETLISQGEIGSMSEGASAVSLDSAEAAYSLVDVGNLRRAIVWKEILDKPVGLRNS